MAGKKISELPELVEVTGEELIHVVSGGVSHKAAANKFSPTIDEIRAGIQNELLGMMNSNWRL